MNKDNIPDTEELNEQIISNLIEDSEANPYLNRYFTEKEVLNGIKRLKNNKATGLDHIQNEFLKFSSERMLSVFTKYFNLILDSGKVPESWTIGAIKPIFKKKGNTDDPDNYRGITLLSCFGKLFTLLINERFTEYIDPILTKAQAGFRGGYSTIDHIFNLKCLIDISCTFDYGLFCAFIDFRKAFDKVHRISLWKKMLDLGLNGKLFQITKHMYDNAKSCVVNNGHSSEYFLCSTGVRQGENLSPLLFSIFLNDIENFFTQEKCEHIKLFPKMFKMGDDIDNLRNLLKLFLLMYADDTVLLAESAEGLQKALDTLETYCTKWHLTVNTEKTKILIFTRKKKQIDTIFHLNGRPLEKVDCYNYLGIIFSKNGKFYKARKRLYDQANKAMFAVLQKGKALNLPLDLQLKLFDETVEPILLYGSEVWGFEDPTLIDSLQLKYIKYIFKLRKTTPTCMILGETERYPLNVEIKCRMVNFWAKLVTDKSNKISSTLYQIILHLHLENKMHSAWLVHIEKLFNDAGMRNIWTTQMVPNTMWLKHSFKLRAQDQYKQKCLALIQESEKCTLYRSFKTEHRYESYLNNSKIMFLICRFRTGNNKLPVNMFDHETPRHERTCNLCDKNALGDEYHFLLECPKFAGIRQKYIHEKYYDRPNMLKFAELMQCKETIHLYRLAKFITLGLKHF